VPLAFVQLLTPVLVITFGSPCIDRQANRADPNNMFWGYIPSRLSALQMQLWGCVRRGRVVHVDRFTYHKSGIAYQDRNPYGLVGCFADCCGPPHPPCLACRPSKL
jgi:hypothetical protein